MPSQFERLVIRALMLILAALPFPVWGKDRDRWMAEARTFTTKDDIGDSVP